MKRYPDTATTRRRTRPAATRQGNGRRRRAALLFVCIAALLALAIRVHAWLSPAGAPAPSAIAIDENRVPGQVLPPAAVLEAGITPRACLLLLPSQGNTHHTIFVDPGHGGQDPGASGVTSDGKTIFEKDVTLGVSLKLSAMLRDAGYTVVLARDSDTLVTRTLPGDLKGKFLTAAGVRRDIQARVACANAANAQLLVAIHFDAYSDPAVNGAETLYDSARPFSAANRRLALLAQTDMLSRMRAEGWAVPDRGVLDDRSVGTPALTIEGAVYGHLLELGPAAANWLKYPSTMPGILAEPLFLTHPAEADVASSALGQHAIANGLAQAIGAYFAANSRGAA